MPEREVNPDVRHEKSDASVRGIIGFGVGLGVLAVLIHLTMDWTFSGLKEREARENRPEQPVSSTRPVFPRDLGAIPPPRLQEAPAGDLAQLRQEENALLHTFGWADAKEGIVRLPIDEALRLLANPQVAAAHGIRFREKQR